jgi:hypothetical protein
MVHLRIFYAASREPGLLHLPIEVIATIFKHMAESNILIGILKIVKDGLPKGHKYYVSEAVEIRRGADDDTARPQDLPETFQHDVTRYWQMLDDFRKKDEVEFGAERRLSFA